MTDKQRCNRLRRMFVYKIQPYTESQKRKTVIESKIKAYTKAEKK